MRLAATAWTSTVLDNGQWDVVPGVLSTRVRSRESHESQIWAYSPCRAELWERACFKHAQNLVSVLQAVLKHRVSLIVCDTIHGTGEPTSRERAYGESLRKARPRYGRCRTMTCTGFCKLSDVGFN
jgi:hypothetical protein